MSLVVTSYRRWVDCGYCVFRELLRLRGFLFDFGCRLFVTSVVLQWFFACVVF